MRQDQLIIALLVACCVTAIGWVVAQDGNWEAQLFDGESYYLLELPKSSIWHSPDLPTYSEFRRVHDLPRVPLQPPKINAVVRWWLMIEKIMGLLWIISIVFWVAGLTESEVPSNITLRFVRMFACSLTLAVVLSIMSWLVFGGWGPPSPLPYAFLGIVVGTIREWIILRRKQNQ